jgi:hypothetical protein
MALASIAVGQKVVIHPVFETLVDGELRLNSVRLRILHH